MKHHLDFTYLDNKMKHFRYIVLVFLLSCVLLGVIFFTGGSHLGTSSLMYIPIFFMVKRYHIAGGVISGIIFGLIFWFVMPLDTSFGMMMGANTAIVTMILFVTFGIIAGYFFMSNERKLYTSKMLFSKIDDAYCFVNNKGQILSYNDMFIDYINDILVIKNIDTANLKGLSIYTLLKENEFKGEKETLQLLFDTLKNKKSVDYYPIKVDYKGEEFTLEHRIETVQLDNSELGCILTVNNYKSKHKYEEKLRTIRNSDEITGLKNKFYFDHYISSVSEELFPQGVLFIDIDNFKYINDIFGYDYGNYILRTVANLLCGLARVDDMIIRYGSDELLVHVPNATPQIVDKMILDIKNALSNISFNGEIVQISYGYAIRETMTEKISSTIYQAEQNMNLNKNIKSPKFEDNLVNVIMSALHEKDVYSEIHSKSVGKYAYNIGVACGLSLNQVTEITVAAMLHDIGKIFVQDDILQKETKLTTEEFEKIKQHSEAGYRLLSNIDGMENISKIVLAHHERWDGKGYPSKLSGGDIPLGSRIISVADTFDALTTNRSYRDKSTIDYALKEIHNNKGTQFDPMILNKIENNLDTIFNR